MRNRADALMQELPARPTNGRGRAPAYWQGSKKGLSTKGQMIESNFQENWKEDEGNNVGPRRRRSQEGRVDMGGER